jgi:hypothetical protein
MEELLSSLREVPRARLSPCFAARLTAIAASQRTPPRRASRLLFVYWGAFIALAGPMLAQHWWGIAIAIAATAAATATRAATIARP